MATLDDRLLPVFANQHWLATVADVEAAGGSIATDGFGRGAAEISIPRGLEHRRTGALVHTSTDLERCKRVVIDGIPTTGFERTILDIGRKVRDGRLLQAIEWGRRTDRTDWPAMIQTLAHHARRGRPGIRRLRRVIVANMDRDEVTDSTFELLALALIAEFGLPTPVLHHKVFARDRFVAEVDLAHPELKIAIELDGSVHLRRQVRERDLARQNDLVLEGWVVLRFSWRRFADHPQLVIAEIRAAIMARTAS